MTRSRPRSRPDPTAGPAVKPRLDPRVERTRAVVLGAAREMLADRGYAGFTIDALVARTGVAKTTVYRHWPSRTELLHDALSSTKPSSSPRDSGDLAADLNALLRGVVYATGRDVYLRSMPSLVDAAQHDPDLQELHDRLADERSRGLRELLSNAQARGELRADCDVEILAHTLIGLVFVRRIFRGLPVTDQDIAQLVDMVLRGAAPATPGPPAPAQKVRRSRSWATLYSTEPARSGPTTQSWDARP